MFNLGEDSALVRAYHGITIKQASICLVISGTRGWCIRSSKLFDTLRILEGMRMCVTCMDPCVSPNIRRTRLEAPGPAVPCSWFKVSGRHTILAIYKSDKAGHYTDDRCCAAMVGNTNCTLCSMKATHRKSWTRPYCDLCSETRDHKYQY